METLIVTIHVLACLFLVVVILLQSGQEGMGVIFGGGSSTMFGSTGAGGLLVKITAGLAVIFLITSLTYNVITGNKVSGSESVMMNGADVTAPAPEQAKKPGVTFKDTEQDKKSE